MKKMGLFSVLHFSPKILISNDNTNVGIYLRAFFLQKWTKLLNNCCNGITQSLTKHNTIANRSSAFIPALIFSAIFCPNSYPSTKLLLHFSAITKLGPHCLLKSYLKSISEKEFFLQDYFSFQVGFPLSPVSISPFFASNTTLLLLPPPQVEVDKLSDQICN